MDALRDWWHARDYVEMQWLMLQQDEPDDYVIATGIQYSVRQFVEETVKNLGVSIRWEGTAENEIGIISDVSEDSPCVEKVKVGDVIVRVDPRYYRPTEVETLLGDPRKAKEKLGWESKTTFSELVSEMTQNDLELAKRDALVETHGYKSFSYNE